MCFKSLSKLLKISLNVCVLLSFTSTTAFALVDGVEITGEKSVTLPVNLNKFQCSDTTFSCTSLGTKTVKLQTVKLDPQFKKRLKNKVKILLPANNTYRYSQESGLSNPELKNPDFKMYVNLGMANVPVLDQGSHGTCVTFSTTAALDAYKKAGDAISQQCLLELGNFEEESSEGNIMSGWDGAYFEDVLKRINTYGVVTKSKCPHQYANPKHKLSPNEYLSYSMNGQWAHDFNTQNLHMLDANGTLIQATVEQVKSALDNGHRVLIGSFILLDYVAGLPIKNLPNGLWDFPSGYTQQQLDSDIMQDKIAGHAIIITGYDDKLKLFKIRNSWGRNVGDNGEFYMTYRYFEVMNMDTIEVY